MGKYQAELAKMFKDRENVKAFEPCVGEVIKPLPELTITILNGSVILYPEMLYMNNRLYDDYTRDYEFIGEIENTTINTTSSNDMAGPGPHSHPHGTIQGKGEMSSKGIITNTDTLVPGDLVKVTPVQEGQLWVVDFIIRKVKK